MRDERETTSSPSSRQQLFRTGTQVWARNAFRRDVLWPAVVADAEQDVPETVRKSAVPGRLCVMYFGPSNSVTRERDWYWTTAADLRNWEEDELEDLQVQNISGRDRKAFIEALQEAKSPSRVQGQQHRAGRPAQQSLQTSQQGPSASRDVQDGACCTSCGMRVPPGETSSIGGGCCCHCIRLSMEGHCCNVCWRPWVQSSNEMVACDRCNTWVHAECDPLSTVAVEASQRAQGCTYFCPICRDSISHHEKARLVMEYENRVRECRPTNRPETPLGLLAAEIGRKYRRQNIHIDVQRLVGLANDMWKVLTPVNKKVYQDQAKKLGEGHMKRRAQFEGVLVEYKKLAESIAQPVPHDLDIDVGKFTALGVKRRPETSLEGMRSQKQPCVGPSPMFPPRFDRNLSSQWQAQIGHQRNSAFSHFNPLRIKEEDYDYVAREHNADATVKPTNNVHGMDQNGVIQKIPIVCNGILGTFLLGLQRVICSCSTCAKESPDCREFTATQFEQHCGAGSAKKWKASLRIQPGSLPEVPKDAAPLALGKWFDMKGIETKASRPSFSKHPHPGLASRAKAAEKCGKEKKVANGKCRTDRKGEELEPWRQVEKGGYTTIQVCYAGDRCSACDSDVDYDCDQLIICDGCGMCVHQTCYGVPEAPRNDQIWLCAVCERRNKGEPSPRCCLCPIEGGALKPTDIPGLWAHVACMQWIPEVTVGDPSRMEPIKRITHIQKERWELPCSLCKQRMGAKIQCLQCYSTYHPLCARMAGLHMEMQEGRSGPTGPWQLVTYCPRHCKPRPELSGVHRVKSDSENGATQLFSRQPFKQPPAVDVPICPAGSARAQPLADWVRVSHGTGAGFSSSKAYWIPEPPEQVFKMPTISKDSVPKSQKVRQGSGRQRNSSRRDRRPVGPVDLLPLPEGVPESITVECNGRRGTLLVRSQRVLYMDEETTASRFEQICGKGEAKKWKCSLWHVGENGEQPMQMQDWLVYMNLDRKVLSNLQSNLTAYNLYQQYIDSQVEEVVDEIVDAVDTGHLCDKSPSTAVDCSDMDVETGTNVDLEEQSTRPASSVGHSSEGSHSEQTVTHHEISTGASAGRGPGQQGHHDPTPSESQPQRPISVHGDDEYRTPGSGKLTTCCKSVEGSGRVRAGLEDDYEGSKLSPEGANPQAEDALPSENGCDRGRGDLAPASMVSPKMRGSRVRLGNRQMENEATSVVWKCMLRRTSSQISPSPSEPTSCLNQACQLYWPDDDEWYSAVVKEHRDSTAEYRVVYDVDQQEEWLDLQVELAEGRLKWIQESMDQGEKLAAELTPKPAEPEDRNPNLGDGPNTSDADAKCPASNIERAEDPGDRNSRIPSGGDAVNMKLSIWWDDDSMYYPGIVMAYKEATGEHHIRYDDGDEEWLELSREHVIWDERQVQEKVEPKAGSHPNTPHAVENTTNQPSGPAPRVNVPDEVSVICNGMEAVYKVKKTSVVVKDGSEMTPTEFERVAGKGASKKWKASIRLLESDGGSGISLGEWLIDQGLDAPKSRTSRSSEEEPRRHRRKSSLESDRRRPRHRQNCMCIICKQARRKGVSAGQQSTNHSSGIGGPKSPKTDTPQSWRPATTTAATRAVGPTIRSGKRAYVEACPQLIRGASTHYMQDLPFSRCWTPESFDRERKKLRLDASAVGNGSEAGEKTREGHRTEFLDDKVIRTKLESWRIQLKECQATERQRIVFGKSGIHGWGLFARKRLKKDSMIIEYRGEVVSPVVADLREKKYKEQGKDCYLFHISEDCVIDATVTGALGRFTNHSCAPSMYTKILHVDGEYHLCFFSRYEILPGQELTYDYRFKEEAAENKIACQCGAPTCRGFMN